MIVIEDLQLTPKRVPIGGNYLLRVLARYIEDGGDDVTITTQDVPLAWTLDEELKIMYAPLDMDCDTFSRILGSYAKSDDGSAVIKVPGMFSIGGQLPITMYLGQLYGYSLSGDGYCLMADLRDVYADDGGGTLTEIMVEFYQTTFAALCLYILEG